ncbi:tonB-system energizer ExbB [Oleispirillum naphthae]|uniref:tonB-system energizer ExbB n=1 Tax=Oleispirillum naphthae TaxID=2838853 RepID=UPI00308223EE
METTVTGTVIAVPHDLSPWTMFVNAHIVVQLVMIGLALASVATWTVAIAKTVEIRRGRRAAAAALAMLAEARSLADADRAAAPGPAAALVAAAAAEVRLSAGSPCGGLKERVSTRLSRAEAAAGRRIALGTGILASIGATAPFIGLFGTVWGIMNSFVGIARAHTTNLAVVAPGIAEALLATAMGLIAAIPAVIVYNALARAIAAYRAQLADISAAVEGIVSRDFDRRGQSFQEAAE